MQILHPEEQSSSLGISRAFNEDAQKKQQENKRDSMLRSVPLTDSKFKVPSREATTFSWILFYISLYYNKLAVNTFGFLTGWKWYNRIDDSIILGALPTPSQVRTLHNKEGVNTIVNLCAEFPGYEKLYNELNITQIRLETPDFTVPSADTIQTGIIAILSRIQKYPRNTVYLHCKAGKGRSAAIAICYLLRLHTVDPKEAQSILLEKRPQVDKDLFQADEIRIYYKKLLADIEIHQYSRKPYIGQSGTH